MNKEKEIEEMAKAIDYVIYQYSSDPNTPPDNNLSECIAYDLIVRGYGNVKQAVKDFAEKLKEQMELNGYRSPLHNRIIDNLITELYGVDE